MRHRFPLHRSGLSWLLAALSLLLLLLLPILPARADTAALQRIQTLVVIVAENHSFDNLFGLFPGADGIGNASAEQKTQLDHDGQPLRELLVFGRDGQPDPRFPRLPNGPFRIDAEPVNRGLDEMVPNPVHAFWHQVEQVNGGLNNRFAAVSNVGGWVMGHYDGSSLKLWQWAREYTLADRFFAGSFGGSFINHQYLVCACIPRFPNAPETMRALVDAQGLHLREADSPSAAVGALRLQRGGGGPVSPDGLVLRTAQPPYQPSEVPPAADGPPDLANPRGKRSGDTPVPPQTQATIGDRLSAKGLDWAWYAGGWNAAQADGRQAPKTPRRVIDAGGVDGPRFQTHHQPFNYFERFAPGTPDRQQHLRDGGDLLRHAAAGTLPPVAFYKPGGRFSEHPGYATVKSGDEHIDQVLRALRASPQWEHMLVVVTYDENGGYWDHVPPPTGPGWADRFGPATRVPTVLIGPHVKRGHVDHTVYDSGSILKFITERWGLQPLPGVRANVGNLSAALQ